MVQLHTATSCDIYDHIGWPSLAQVQKLILYCTFHCEEKHRKWVKGQTLKNIKKSSARNVVQCRPCNHYKTSSMKGDSADLCSIDSGVF